MPHLPRGKVTDTDLRLIGFTYNPSRKIWVKLYYSPEKGFLEFTYCQKCYHLYMSAQVGNATDMHTLIAQSSRMRVAIGLNAENIKSKVYRELHHSHVNIELPRYIKQPDPPSIFEDIEVLSEPVEIKNVGVGFKFRFPGAEKTAIRTVDAKNTYDNIDGIRSVRFSNLFGDTDTVEPDTMVFPLKPKP